MCFYNLIKKETAPYDDRSSLVLRMTAPEGASYEVWIVYARNITIS
jgi:multidrug efflux pump subunit AcrB